MKWQPSIESSVIRFGKILKAVDIFEGGYKIFSKILNQFWQIFMLLGIPNFIV